MNDIPQERSENYYLVRAGKEILYLTYGEYGALLRKDPTVMNLRGKTLTPDAVMPRDMTKEERKLLQRLEEECARVREQEKTKE